MPGDADLESTGGHVSVVTLRRGGAKHVWDGRSRDNHIDGLTQVGVSGDGEAAVEEAGVQTHVVGGRGLPSQVIRKGARSGGIPLLDTVQKPAGSGDAHRLLVLVIAKT